MPKLFSADFLATLQTQYNIPESTSSENDSLLRLPGNLWVILAQIDEDLTSASQALEAIARDSETNPYLKKIHYALIQECKKNSDEEIKAYAYSIENNLYTALIWKARLYFVPNCLSATILSPLSMVLCCFHEQEGCRPGELGVIFCDTPSPYSGKELANTVLQEDSSGFSSLFCRFFSPRTNCLKLLALTHELDERLQENIANQQQPLL